MTDLVVAVGSFFTGCLVAGVVAGGILRRLVDRHRARSVLERTTADLEKRRRATDSGRSTLPRQQAGPAARIVDAMPAHQKGSKTSTKKNRGNA